jgi:hypothetical protein
MNDIKASANSYILTMLLQRLEHDNPGLLAGMINGVKADKNAVLAGDPERQDVVDVFHEALMTLERAHQLLNHTDVDANRDGDSDGDDDSDDEVATKS